MTEYRGLLRADGERFAIVVARFNEVITDRLLSGARSAFRQHGVPDEAVDVAWVPGAMELPVVAQKLARSGSYAAVVCLGAVIRGDTPHFEYVSSGAATGIGAVARETGVPILFGVLTTENVEQATDRSGAKSGNKGYDVAVDAIEMASLMEQIDQRQ
ncbi:MAG: ribH [Chloroflexi bacterium]|nr:ribH [Chloroflexota bacterium]